MLITLFSVIFVQITYMSLDQSRLQFLLENIKSENDAKKEIGDILIEQIRLYIQLRKTEDGKKWLKKLTSTSDKEEQIHSIFNIATCKAKMYLNLLQIENKKYLDMYLNGKSLKAAYEASIKKF